MGKAKGSDEEKTKAKLLEGLRKGLDGGPHPLNGPATGPALFPGGAGGAKLAQRAREGGLVEDVSPAEPATKTKGKTKAVAYARVTDKGVQYVLESDSPVKVLQGLRDQLEAEGPQLREGVQQLQAKFASYQQMARVLSDALERATRQPTQRPPAVTPTPDGWLDEVVRIVAEQKRRNSFDRPTLPQLYEQLKQTRPGLTLGLFHDGLRILQAQRRIRLTAYTQTLATLPDAQNALYLDREVKYYVDLP